MTCYNCPNRSLYKVALDSESIELCLDCYFKFSLIQQRDLENAERMINYSKDQIFASIGLAPTGARFPLRPQPVFIGDTKLNNININNSVVGTINTGSIGMLDQCISALVQLGNEEVAASVKAITEAVLKSNDLTQNQKNEVIESLSVISREAATPEASRQNTAALSLLDKAVKITSAANDISDICLKFWPLLISIFNIA